MAAESWYQEHLNRSRAPQNPSQDPSWQIHYARKSHSFQESLRKNYENYPIARYKIAYNSQEITPSFITKMGARKAEVRIH